MTEWDIVSADGESFGHGDRLTPGPCPSGERGDAGGTVGGMMDDPDDGGQDTPDGVRVPWEVSVRGVSGRQRDNARVLRRHPTPQEELIWKALRGRRIEGLKFRRQVPVGRFLVDFMCFEAGLIIEVDGSQHDDVHVREYDDMRTRYLNEQGFEVVRFTHREIDTRLSDVVNRIRSRARARTTTSEQAPLSPEGEGLGVRR